MTGFISGKNNIFFYIYLYYQIIEKTILNEEYSVHRTLKHKECNLYCYLTALRKLLKPHAFSTVKRLLAFYYYFIITFYFYFSVLNYSPNYNCYLLKIFM